jgi:hypothetical protein
VIDPALEAAPGVARVAALAERFFAYLEGEVFPGGCFFASAAAELAPREGPVRERIRGFAARWMGLLERELEAARADGALAATADPAQLAFEVNALMLGANEAFVLFGDPGPIGRGRAGIGRLLEAAAR